MLRSMTGYGKQVIQMEKYTVIVEMRSVNNRFLDIAIKMPYYLLNLEDKIKNLIKASFERGKLDVFITIHGQGSVEKNLQVDWNLIEQYKKNINKIKEHHQLEGELSISSLLTLSDIFEVVEQEKADDTLEEHLLEAVTKSCQEMLEMRETEGKFLEKDLEARLMRLEELTLKLEEVRPLVVQEYQERILKRINDYLINVKTIDETRIHQEVAILAEKGDITEEITRIKSHIEHMRKILNETGSVGRKLDFICQELHREANTIGSKSTAAEINKIDVLMKSEIEKIKEQVQNIE